jgi:hypothetical protein
MSQGVKVPEERAASWEADIVAGWRSSEAWVFSAGKLGQGCR